MNVILPSKVMDYLHVHLPTHRIPTSLLLGGAPEGYLHTSASGKLGTLHFIYGVYSSHINESGEQEYLIVLLALIPPGCEEIPTPLAIDIMNEGEREIRDFFDTVEFVDKAGVVGLVDTLDSQLQICSPLAVHMFA
jgi:hypothetical protein